MRRRRKSISVFSLELKSRADIRVSIFDFWLELKFDFRCSIFGVSFLV